MNALFLSNTNIDLVAKKVSPRFDRIFNQSGFDTWQEDLFLAARGIECTCVFIIIDGFSLWEKIRNLDSPSKAAKEMVYSVAQAAVANPLVHFFVSIIEISGGGISEFDDKCFSCESSWNSAVFELCSKSGNVHSFDMREWVYDAGREHVYSMKLWYLGGIRYSSLGQKILAQKISEMAAALTSARKKCLILDADNTLWGGIIGEDGIGGIQLSPVGEGARYYHFQRAIMEIASTGIVCAIVSKNNESDLKDVLASHPYMLLRESFFVSIHVGWNNKDQEILSLADELNIGLDSMVFIDDNPAERELVRESLPEVTVPEFPVDTAELSFFIRDVYQQHFRAVRLTAEDLAKTEQYHQNALRQKELSSSIDYATFLSKLKIRVIAKKADIDDVARIAQLCNKTNQFNLTTKRYTEADISKMLADSSFDIYSFVAEDRFGSYGTIAAVIVRADGEGATIDTFLLSCRAMGKMIEFGIISFIFEHCSGKGFRKVIGPFIPTSKNAPAKEFYLNVGFNLLSSDEEGQSLYIKELPSVSMSEFIGEVVSQ